VIRFLVRIVATRLVRLRRRFVSRGPGVLAAPLTPEGRLVLVRLTYAPGWRLPGGGIEAGEEPRAAALRELGEEIGMTGHGEVACVDADGAATLFLVRDVRYSPRRSWEIEEVAEFETSALPDEATPLTRRKIAEALALLRSA
jgi:8-oxo-dGTP pyrophosphatase MutT (NUDIX family)